MKVKDNTPAQTERWVLQEAAKHTEVQSIERRIAGERSSIELFAKAGFDKTLPNSHQAHYKLIQVLALRLAGLYKVQCGDRFADSIGTLWEITDLIDGNVKLWNRSYNAFQNLPIEKLMEMKRS